MAISKWQLANGNWQMAIAQMAISKWQMAIGKWQLAQMAIGNWQNQEPAIRIVSLALDFLF
jgi:hypothetical protein